MSLSRSLWGQSSALPTFFHLFAGHRKRLAVASLLYVVKHSPAVLLPVITGLTIDALAAGNALDKLWLLGAGGALLIAQNLPGHYFFVRWLSLAIRDVERALRGAIARHIQQIPIGSYQALNPAMLQSKSVRDVEAIEQMTRVLADGVLGAGCSIAVALVVTAWRVPQFLLLFLLTVPVASMLIVLTRNRLAERNERFRRAVEAMHSRIGEMASLVPLTRAHALEDAALERVDETFGRVHDEGLALDSINAWFNGVSWVSFQGLNLLCLLVAGWAYHSKLIPITLGDVVLLSGFFSSLTSAVVGMSSLVPVISRGLEAVHSIGEFMREEDDGDSESLPALEHVEGRVELQEIGFHYPGQSKLVLNGVSLAVEPGETIALVGPSGSGKSTLLNIVIGLLRPSQGKILLDGRDAATLNLRRWREHIAVVPQDCQLFIGTIRENLVFGLSPVRDETLRQAINDAGCDFIAALPEGLETRVGGGAVQLSGGQRQRLAIARAFVRNPRLLFLDEASSALDTASEMHIQSALARLKNGRTTFIVAHRMSTVRQADRIVVLDGGKIVAAGRHESLLADCPLYRLLALGELADLSLPT